LTPINTGLQNHFDRKTQRRLFTNDFGLLSCPLPITTDRQLGVTDAIVVGQLDSLAELV
jgi:hypothetical protein